MFFQTQNKNNISILEFKRLIGVSYRTAWRIKHKLMEVMFEREQSTMLRDVSRSMTPISVANYLAVKPVAAPKTKPRS